MTCFGLFTTLTCREESVIVILKNMETMDKFPCDQVVDIPEVEMSMLTMPEPTNFGYGF